MAKLSGLAYLDGKKAKPKMKDLGYTTHKFIDIDGLSSKLFELSDSS